MRSMMVWRDFHHWFCPEFQATQGEISPAQMTCAVECFQKEVAGLEIRDLENLSRLFAYLERTMFFNWHFLTHI